MAQQLSPGGVPFFLHVGKYSDSPQSAISYSAAETAHAGLTLTQGFASLTGLFQGGPVSPDSYQVLRGKSVIDIVKDDLDTLERFDMSQADRSKLEAWKELLDQTTQVVSSAQCSSDLAATLGATQANVDAVGSASLGTDILTSTIAGGLDGADIHSSVAVLAAVCNANPVIFLKYPASYAFRGLGLDMDAETVSGRLDNAGSSGPCVDGAIDRILLIDDFYARKFAVLVGMLDGIEEGDGKVLDNTAAIWFQENSDGAAQNTNNIPIVQAGSCGGYFKTGGAINLDGGSPDLTAGNSEGACTSETTDTIDGLSKVTGTDPKLANAPINKYYCNIMNALGVKAGEDGFPSKDGQAEVSCFGMYDKTEDFIGGGSIRPRLHNPGEYAELKA
jgi:hypothetical protein